MADTTTVPIPRPRKAPRDVQVQVRFTEDEAAVLVGKGEELAKDFSGLRKIDGSINLSAVIRHLTLRGER